MYIGDEAVLSKVNLTSLCLHSVKAILPGVPVVFLSLLCFDFRCTLYVATYDP